MIGLCQAGDSSFSGSAAIERQTCSIVFQTFGKSFGSPNVLEN